MVGGVDRFSCCGAMFLFLLIKTRQIGNFKNEIYFVDGHLSVIFDRMFMPMNRSFYPLLFRVTLKFQVNFRNYFQFLYTGLCLRSKIKSTRKCLTFT